MKLRDDRNEFKSLFGAAKSAYTNMTESKRQNRDIGKKKRVLFSCKEHKR